MRLGTSCAFVAVVLLATNPSIARAQGFNAIGGKSSGQLPPKVPPPPALPGAAPNANRVAPAVRPPSDMEPNEALFDAINRGDIGAVRDAISRGADLDGRNILGMTPMELSVDLGRNDISFLLLSLRGGDNAAGRQPAAAANAKQPQPPQKQAKQARASTTPVRAPQQAPVAPQTARLFSGDGGTPIPNAGFLGFDTNRR